MIDHNEYIDKVRADFTKGTLGETDVLADPSEQFEAWLKQAVESEVPELQAMNLATVYDNRPSSRIVYLRKIHNHKFWWYGNYDSKKGQSLEQNPNASLNFFWPELQRQVRIEGVVKKATDDNSDNYFNSRPLESKLGAWASAQSYRLTSRKELEDKLEQLHKQFEGKEIPRPPHWGGWVLKANYYEFWQGRPSRLHDRICYEQQGETWNIFRLAP
ncbi:MAG: Pyridoxamine 5-phosphate oxidase [Bacteroidetes bacterium]|jgi:pyridoxamine 5'-phosphate oxidase|nr:Pyridoxamine 5-phosphate oxidase [Bacteroidota bacterium]